MRAQDRALIEAVERFRFDGNERTPDRLEELILRPFQGSFERIAYFMRPSMSRFVDGDEVLGLCLQAAWRLLCSNGSDGMPAEMSSSAFIPMMRRQVAQLARKESERSPRSGLAGTTAIMRRRSQLDKQRTALWATLGRAPTDDEVIEAHNETMLATRSNPGRQGALASRADLISPSAVAVEDDELIVMAGASDDSAEQDVASVMQDIIMRCYDESELCGMVAESMLASVDLNSSKSAATLSRELSVARESVAAAMRDVQQVTITVLDEFAMRPSS